MIMLINTSLICVCKNTQDLWVNKVTKMKELQKETDKFETKEDIDVKDFNNTCSGLVSTVLGPVGNMV